MINMYMKALFKTLPSLLLLAFALVARAATPEVGYEIVNQAAVGYIDVNGEERVVTTNEVVITVQQVYSATIEIDRVQPGAPGQEVKFFHTLTNTGNGEDLYHLSTSQNYQAGPGSDDGDFDYIYVYHDLNHNGVVDPTDLLVATSTSDSDLLLQGGEVASLIVVAGIPSSALPNEEYTLTIEAEAYEGGPSPQNGTVDDLTLGQGEDGADDTNEDITTVTDNAVLEVTKSSIHNLGLLTTTTDDTITYTVTMRNIGQSDAVDVNITDVLPPNVVFDNTFVITSSNAALYTTGAGLDGTPGALPTHAGGTLTGHIDRLPPFQDVDFTYRVTLDGSVQAFDEVRNIATINGDVDENGTPDGDVDSNETLDLVPPYYGVVITDTGVGPSPGINDGGDDDAANDIQYVDQADGGETIIFRHIVTNLGNVIDAFNITVEAGRRADGGTPGADPFPAGTTFQLLHADGFTPLLDTDGDGIPDTGNMDPNEQLEIVVRAILPADATVAADTYTSIRATSTEDPAAVPVNDLTEERMAPVEAQQVDLANTSVGLGDATNIDAVDGTPVTTLNGQTSQIVTFDLFVANEGGSDDTYNLEVWADAAATIPLPPEWNVEFQTVDGDAITATPLIDSGAVFEYRALVTIPSLLPTPNPFDLYFRVVSTESGVSDVKQDAVNVIPRSGLDFTNDQHSTVSPCSSVVYSHRVANSGETSELVLIEITEQSQFTGLLWYPIGPVGEVPTVFNPKTSFSAGDDVAVYDASLGDWTTVQLVDAGGELAIPLDAGDFTYIELRFMVPCDTQLDIVDTAVLNASYVSGNADPVDNTDITTVSNVNVSLDKQGALDADCNDQPDVPDSFSRDTVIAEPGNCVIWQIVISNLYTTNVCGVEIHDSAPSWTDVYNAGPTPLPSVVDSPGTTGPARCVITGDNIDCVVGDDFDIDDDGDLEQNCILAGQTATVWFSVQIE